MKKKGCYRWLAWLLCFSMLFQTAGITSYASEITNGEENESEELVSLEEVESQADSFESEYLIYEVISESEKTVKLTGVNRADFNYKCQYEPPFSAADITIPATVSNGGVTYNVVEIGDFAFADYVFMPGDMYPYQNSYQADDNFSSMNLYVKKITISEGIKKIGTGAFFRIYHLKEVVLPDSIEEIGQAAFGLDKQRFLSGLETLDTELKVNIPKNIKSIPAYAYSGVTFEGTLKIPNGVKDIGEYAFGWEEEFYNYSVVDVPASVDTIEKNAFHTSSLARAVFRKTTLPEFSGMYLENMYSPQMFGNQFFSNLQVYVSANLITAYSSSAFINYVSGITFKDLAEYSEVDFASEPFHFVYQGEKVTKLEVRGTDVFYVVMDNENLSANDIQWKLKLIKSSCPLITVPEDCVSLTYAEDGSISIKILCSETTVQLIGKVAGYKDVVLHIHGLYQGEGDTFWIDRLEALTEEEITPLATVYSQSGTKEQIEEIRTKAEEITAGCTTDREKIFAIEQWVANHVAYDYDYLTKYYEKKISPYEETPVGAYEVFRNRYTVCAGYAILSEVMVRSIGIPCVYIEGVAGGAHAWNAAYDRENQKWIYFDATWDTAGSLLDSQFTVQDVRDSYFDFDPVQEMTDSARYTLWMNIDERESSYDTTPYVNKHFITLFEGETEQLDFYDEKGDATFVVEEEYVEEDIDFSQSYEKLERKGRFITVDATGKITALKEGQSVIGVRMENDDFNTWEIYVRVMPREEIYFGEETYTLVMGEKGKLDVFRGKGVWENSIWGKKAITELVSLTSDNIGVVKVDDKGNLIPVSIGEATITGKMCFDDSTENLISCKVVVTNQSTVVEEKEEFTQDNLKYEILTKPAGDIPGTVSVIQQSYRNYESSAAIIVEIPETVEYEGVTYKVTAIGKNAFSDLIGRATISIPASVERIEEGAFSSKDQGADLTGELVFPENSQLTYIGPFAFAYNEKLSKVDLSNCTKLEKIDLWSFAECSYFSMDWQGNETSTGIAEVILPENLKVIEQHAFYMCQQLSKINIPKNMDYIGHYAFASTEIGGVIDFSGVKKLGEDILRESYGQIEGIILNDDWTAIEAGLFRSIYASWMASSSCLEDIGGVEKIQSGDVLLSENIKYIGEQAFYSNYIIRNVQAPGVKTIGEEAFYGCGSLERVQASEVEVIGEKAFGQCTSLVDIDFEQNLKVIPEKAFIKCSKLTDFTLSEELTEIGYGSLYECGVLNSMRIPSEKITYFGQRCFKKGMNFYIPEVASNEYMKELKDYSVAFYDLNGNLLESNINGIDALLMEYPQYAVEDSYETIRDFLGVYVEYKDGVIEEIEDYTIENGTFVTGGQEIEIFYKGFTDTVKVGSSPNKQPIRYISPRDPSYSAKIYKTGTSFQQVKDLFVVRAYYEDEDGTYEEFEEYDVWPGTFSEGENWVTFAFCDFVGGAYKTQSRLFTASSDVEEEPDNPDDPEDPNEPDNPDTPDDPNNPDILEGKITGIEVSISDGSELRYTPIAGYKAGQEDFAVYYTIKTETGNKLIEVTEYEIDGGDLEYGENTITIITYAPDGTRLKGEVEVFAEARLEALEIKLKPSVKLKAGDAIKSSQFIGTATYSGVNGYRTTKEIPNFTIEGNAVVAEGMNTFRFSYRENTIAFGSITQTAEWSMCSDDKPVLSVSAVTVNPYAEEETSFAVHVPFGMTAWTNGGFYLNTKGDVLRGISYISDENGVCTIKLSETLKDKTYKLYVKVTVAETENEYYLPIKITLKSVLPKITATAEKINIFFTDEDSRTSEITLKNISGQVIQSAAFEENSAMDKYFDVIFDREEQNLALKLTNQNAAKKDIVSKGKLLLGLEGYKKPVTVNVNIGLSEKAPKVKILPSSVNINTKMYDDKETSFEVTMQDGKNYVPVVLTGTTPEVISGAEWVEQVATSETAFSNKVIVKLKNTADFNKVKTVKINLQAPNWKKPVQVSYKIKTVNTLPKAKLETKVLTLDMRAVGGEMSTFLRFDTTPGDITYKELSEVLTAVKKNESAPMVTLEKVDERNYKVKAVYSPTMQKGTYKYEITPELSDGTKLKKVTLSVKVTTANKAANATLKAQKGSKIELINRTETGFVYKVSPTVKGTYIKEVRLKEIELGKDVADISLFNVTVNKVDGIVDTVEVSASEHGNLLAGKKYKLTFEVIPATSATELTAAEMAVTIAPKESKLQLNANLKSAVLYRNISDVKVEYKVIPKMAGVEIETMEYVPSNKVPEGAFEITQTSNGSYRIRIADKTKVTAKKSYKLSFKVKAKGGTKEVTQNVTIKVQ